MNTDMSVFMAHGQCSWDTWSVFMAAPDYNKGHRSAQIETPE